MILQLAALLGIVGLVYHREHGIHARNKARADVLRKPRRRLP